MQIRIITLVVILFLTRAQGAPHAILNIQQNTERLHNSLFAIGNKKKGGLTKILCSFGNISPCIIKQIWLELSMNSFWLGFNECKSGIYIPKINFSQLKNKACWKV